MTIGGTSGQTSFSSDLARIAERIGRVEFPGQRRQEERQLLVQRRSV